MKNERVSVNRVAECGCECRPPKATGTHTHSLPLSLPLSLSLSHTHTHTSMHAPFHLHLLSHLPPYPPITSPKRSFPMSAPLPLPSPLFVKESREVSHILHARRCKENKKSKMIVKWERKGRWRKEGASQDDPKEVIKYNIFPQKVILGSIQGFGTRVCERERE
ncbi:hypothetical protein IE53DRAFT_160236 [Violaceomyces palustris]|uniref:Uncharacterized protein n=1 Tax=Violaceomyces palustris TaxID=1673888 RepID=A0ACD0NTK6_9BASI|nr:hypothetical protein IE53DRAFT_160236 [Violaceomyces palustris]